MPRMTIEIPDVVYDRMTLYQKNRKPHLSLKDVIVESIDSVLEDYERQEGAKTQINMPNTPEEREAMMGRML